MPPSVLLFQNLTTKNIVDQLGTVLSLTREDLPKLVASIVGSATIPELPAFETFGSLVSTTSILYRHVRLALTNCFLVLSLDQIRLYHVLQGRHPHVAMAIAASPPDLTVSGWTLS